MREYKRCYKKIGPGGLRCNCCNPIQNNVEGKSLKKTKQFLNRLFRRTKKPKEDAE